MSSTQSSDSQNKLLKPPNDDWINGNDAEENDADSFEYLYPTSSYESDSEFVKQSNSKTTDENLKVVRVGFVENISRDKQRPSSRSSPSFKEYHSPQRSIKTKSLTKRRRQSDFIASIMGSEGPTIIKRGKFKGFYDDRRNSCIYSELQPVVKCNKPNCYCQYTTIVKSPLRFETLDNDSFEAEQDVPLSLQNGEENVNVEFEVNPQHQKINLGPQPKNKYSISRVRQKLEYSKSNNNEINPNNSSSVSEKFSKRIKRCHSVNNLSKRSSLNKHHHWLDKYEGIESHAPIERLSSKTHKHNYLKGFKSIDVNFHKPVTTV